MTKLLLTVFVIVFVMTPSRLVKYEIKKGIKNDINNSQQWKSRNRHISTASKARVLALIDRYADIYGINKSLFRAIAYCESRYNPAAKGRTGDGGVYQFIIPTWRGVRRRMGEETHPELRFNAEENVKTAAWKIRKEGVGAWKASRHCWGKTHNE